MPRVIITGHAALGIQRCRTFLSSKASQAATRAAQAIDRQFNLLKAFPEIGRPYDVDHDLRELVIGFGDSGYVALYRYEPKDDVVYVLAFRHQKEAGY